MKNTKPLVSIVLPIYNSEEFLEACLDSLCSQSYKAIEIIAVDDLSKDNSRKILNLYKKQDNRVRVLKNKKRYGLAICLNRAMKKTKGDFVTFMDPQDRCKQNRITKQISYLLTHSKIAALGTQCSYADKHNRKTGQSSFPYDGAAIYKNLLSSSSIQPETVLINRKLLPKDLLKFKSNAYPFVYNEVFLNIFQYGEFANLLELLYYRRKIDGENEKGRLLFKLEYLIPFLKLFIKSITQSDYNPSMKSLLQGLAK